MGIAWQHFMLSRQARRQKVLYALAFQPQMCRLNLYMMYKKKEPRMRESTLAHSWICGFIAVEPRRYRAMFHRPESCVWSKN